MANLGAVSHTGEYNLRSVPSGSTSTQICGSNENISVTNRIETTGASLANCSVYGLDR